MSKVLDLLIEDTRQRLGPVVSDLVRDMILHGDAWIRVTDEGAVMIPLEARFAEPPE